MEFAKKNCKMKSYIITFMLFLLTSFGVKAGTPSWTVNPYAYQYSMTATGILVIDHIESADTADIIGAFVGPECRGFTKPIYILSLGRYIAFLMIYSDTASGENVSFKMYDSSEDTVLNATQIIPFVPNNTLGLITNPYVWSNTSLSQDAHILSYSIPQQAFSAVIVPSAHTVQVTVPHGTTTLLVATFTLSTFADATIGTTIQQSGVTLVDFTAPVVYTVTAEDPAYTQNWTVTVTEQPGLNSATDILDFTLPQQTGAATINTINHDVNIQVTSGTNIGSLVASFTLSSGASAKVNGTIQQSGITVNDFTYSVIYEIKAEDSTLQNWIVTVSNSSGVEEDLFQNSISVYPNPTKGLLNITCDINADMMVYDKSGRLVFRGALNSAKNTFDLGSIDNGTYILKLTAGKKEVSSKIIIRK